MMILKEVYCFVFYGMQVCPTVQQDKTMNQKQKPLKLVSWFCIDNRTKTPTKKNQHTSKLRGQTIFGRKTRG